MRLDDAVASGQGFYKAAGSRSHQSLGTSALRYIFTTNATSFRCANQHQWEMMPPVKFAFIYEP
jgi:hypothetical protein